MLILSAFILSSQNKQVLYNFAELPQTLLLNPATEVNYKRHIGVPLLSGLSVQASSTGFTLLDIFSQDGRNINDKIASIFDRLKTTDFARVNTQIEVLSAGYRKNSRTYLSFGFYQEIDAIGYYPKDVVILATEGNLLVGNNSYLNKNFMVSHINYKVDVLGVWHFGITKKMNEKLILGGRFKIYSSALNLESTSNSGAFTTVQGTNNLYTHYFNNIDLEIRSAGLVDSNTNEYIEDVGDYVGKTFFGGSTGFGLDFGITYKFSEQLEFSGSILDFGFINHKKNVKNTKVEGNFSYEGVDFLFDSGNSANYWDLINERFKRDLPTTEHQDVYISWRPTKVNAALKYSFGNKRGRVCYDDVYKDFYDNAIGFQIFTVFRPLSPQFALTGFYEKSITKKLHTKFTYTVDAVSYSNIGAGLSMQIGSVNTYAMVDNILSYSDLSSSNHLSLQLGFNLIFN